jgi:hypothetical protein
MRRSIAILLWAIGVLSIAADLQQNVLACGRGRCGLRMAPVFAPCCAPPTVLAPQLVTEMQTVRTVHYVPEVRTRMVQVCRYVPEIREVEREFMAGVPEVRTWMASEHLPKPVEYEVELRTTQWQPRAEPRQATRTVCRLVPHEEERTICETVCEPCCENPCGPCATPKTVVRKIKVNCPQPQWHEESIDYTVTAYEPRQQSRTIHLASLEHERVDSPWCDTVQAPHEAVAKDEITVQVPILEEHEEQYTVMVPWVEEQCVPVCVWRLQPMMPCCGVGW